MDGGSVSGALASHLSAGNLVAIGDGAGSPVGLRDELADAARSVGGVRLLLGWTLAAPVDLEDAAAFPDVRAHMGGYALRDPLQRGRARSVPVRLGSLGALLAGPLRPDALLAGLRRSGGDFVFGTEVAWMRGLVEAGVPVLAEVNHGLPDTSDGIVVPRDRVVVLSEVERAPLVLPEPPLDELAAAVGRQVARLVPEGATLQYGPGAVGDAAVRSLDVPVRIESGLVTDAARALDARGLLLGTPRAAYVAGTPALYGWADGRRIAAPLELTHDPSRLGAIDDFVAVNTALEIDAVGQVNVEGVGGDPIGGVGGHGDFSLAGSRSRRGFSVVALASRHRGRPTLVEHLSGPVTTPRHDVDVVVNERGSVDLRGLDDEERRRALAALWDGA